MLILAFVFVFVVSLSSFSRVMISEKKIQRKRYLIALIFLVMVICIALELLLD